MPSLEKLGGQEHQGHPEHGRKQRDVHRHEIWHGEDEKQEAEAAIAKRIAKAAKTDPPPVKPAM